MSDAIDLHHVQIERSPTDIADWPVTVQITAVSESPKGGLTLTFDHPLPESWKWPSNPNNPSDNFQFTVWAVVNGYAAGFIQMWQGRSMADGSLPPILADYQNWWGDARHLWGAMSDYVPKVGDVIGIFVSAGNARLVNAVTSVRERSNVVAFAIPAGDSGSWSFSAQPVPSPEPPEQPPPRPAPPAVDLTAVLAKLDALSAKVDALAAKPAPIYTAPYAINTWLTGNVSGTIVLKPSNG